MRKSLLSIAALAALLAAQIAASPQAEASADRQPADPPVPTMADAEMLSPFGGRAAFSPDGTRIAFVGKTWRDAYEIDLKSRRVRNLTHGFPHQGIMRIQYLPDGNFLVTAPRLYNGPDTRAHLELWLLRKDLARGLEPLGEQVFEGVAVSRRRNLIAWTAIEPALKPKENWQLAFSRPTKRYVAEIGYVNGVPRIVAKREIMPRLPAECIFIEPQDFRDGDAELVYSCMAFSATAGLQISVMGNRLAEDRNITYYRQPGEYDEVEGIAPGGDWATVECGRQDKPGLPELDICRLDLREGGGPISVLMKGRVEGSTADISNPVVSPDGKWLVFQRSDSASGDIGEGYGIYRYRLR